VSQRRVAAKSLLLSDGRTEKHEVQVDPDDPDVVMEIWVKELTFLDVQRAAQEMILVKDGGKGIDFSLEGYWRHAFTHWVERTNPELTPDEMLQLSGYVGEQLTKVLPGPDKLNEVLQGGFQGPPTDA